MAIGLIAGDGTLPQLLARSARAQGIELIVAAHRGETDPDLERQVTRLEWFRVGQVAAILRYFARHRVDTAVMAGGIRRVKALGQLRPDWGALAIIAKMRRFGDDALLRAIAEHFELNGVKIVSPTELAPELLAPEGLLVGESPTEGELRDVGTGWQIAGMLGSVDVGQGVVVRRGHTLAVEAAEGTDQMLQRAGALGCRGGVLVKRCKPDQDVRFDLPAVGPRTVEVMASVGLRVLAVEAERSVLLDPPTLFERAQAAGITVLAVREGGLPGAGAAEKPAEASAAAEPKRVG